MSFRPEIMILWFNCCFSAKCASVLVTIAAVVLRTVYTVKMSQAVEN